MTDKPQRLYGWTDPNASPTTLYTDSATLTIGMPLYDNTGTDTGSTVDIINQDGTFDVNSEPLYYCYSYDYGYPTGKVYAYTKNDYGNSLPKGVQIYGIPPYGFDKAASASQLSDMGLSGDISFPRYIEGDLYT